MAEQTPEVLDHSPFDQLPAPSDFFVDQITQLPSMHDQATQAVRERLEHRELVAQAGRLILVANPMPDEALRCFTGINRIINHSSLVQPSAGFTISCHLPCPPEADRLGRIGWWTEKEALHRAARSIRSGLDLHNPNPDAFIPFNPGDDANEHAFFEGACNRSDILGAAQLAGFMVGHFERITHIAITSHEKAQSIVGEGTASQSADNRAAPGDAFLLRESPEGLIGWQRMYRTPGNTYSQTGVTVKTARLRAKAESQKR